MVGNGHISVATLELVILERNESTADGFADSSERWGWLPFNHAAYVAERMLASLVPGPALVHPPLSPEQAEEAKAALPARQQPRAAAP